MNLTQRLMIVCAVALVLGAAPVYGALAQEGTAHVYPQARVTGEDVVAVDVQVDAVDNLAGFQFVLSWDPGVVRYRSIAQGDFLAGTGREPFCTDPVVDEAAVRFVCVTFAAPPEDIADPSAYTPPSGVAGRGTLAVAEFDLLASSSSSFRLSRVKLADTEGMEIASRVSEGALALSNSGAGGVSPWVLVGGGLGAAAVIVLGAVVVLRRGRATQAPGRN